MSVEDCFTAALEQDAWPSSDEEDLLNLDASAIDEAPANAEASANGLFHSFIVKNKESLSII